MSAKLEQPYRYTDPQNRRLTLYPASDRDRPYVWLEAENLAGRTVTVVSVWLRFDQADALCRSLSAGTRFEARDHTGDRLIVKPAREATVEVVRQPVVGEAPATVRIRIPSNRLPELQAAVTVTAGQRWLEDQAALDEETSATPGPSVPASQPVRQRADQLHLFGAAS
ncbi:hypothetical protein [Streptomyces sp. E5N91]|uniref:hypothetical protein n=1 Tax=Streptomyces sp. E5N91 TaxID=1851996 RepID=UPI000EF61526|nr:hypothetical protein [Streptomyces sp. E5N91]